MDSIFDDWSKMRGEAATSPLRETSIQNYRFVWNAWLHLLSDSGLDWTQARPEHVRSFLQSIKPNALHHDLPSSVSQKRYARLLREVYAFAVVNERIAANPVSPSALISFTEAHDSTVFIGATWEKIKDLPIYSSNELSSAHWEDIRNNAIRHLLIFEALQVTEIQELLGQDCLLDPLGQVQRIAIRGSRPAQNRIAILQPESVTAMSQWISLRATKLMEPRGLKPVFNSRKKHGMLSAKSVFLVAREYLQSVVPSDEQGDRLSPGVLRNSCISEWLRSQNPAIVARKAGLQDVVSLSRLLSHT